MQQGATSPKALSSFWSLYFKNNQHSASKYKTFWIQIAMAIVNIKVEGFPRIGLIMEPTRFLKKDLSYTRGKALVLHVVMQFSPILQPMWSCLM